MTDSGNSLPAPAKPSSTIVLLRECDSRPVLLMVKRRAGDAFGDSYAFPGGVVDHDESAARPYCFGLSQEDADRILDVPHDGLDYYSAGIRELFEETGVLLAHDDSGVWACGESLSGELWQQECYDRIVRDEEQLYRVVQYIGRNPYKAKTPRSKWFRWMNPKWIATGWNFEPHA